MFGKYWKHSYEELWLALLYPKRDPTKLYRCGLEMSARQTSRP